MEIECANNPLAHIQADHTYGATGLSEVFQAKLERLESLVEEQKKRVLDLEAELRDLQLSSRKMKIGDIKHDDSKVRYEPSY